MQYPQYEVKILSQDKLIQFRPFTVREEQILLMVSDGSDIESTVNALKQIITNCVIGKVDVENLAMVDIETIFLHLRARSIGETGSQFFKCKNEITTDGGGIGLEIKKECGMLIEVPIKFLEIPIVNLGHDRTIKLDEKFGVKMKYPTLALTRMLGSIEPEDMEITIIANCIETIFTNEEVFQTVDATQEEVITWVNGLLTDKYEKLKEFAFNTPRTKLVVEKKCVKCGYDHTFTLEGIQDFFG